MKREWYSAKELAKQFEVTPTTVRNWEKKGVLEVLQLVPKGTKRYRVRNVEMR